MCTCRVRSIYGDVPESRSLIVRMFLWGSVGRFGWRGRGRLLIGQGLATRVLESNGVSVLYLYRV